MHSIRGRGRTEGRKPARRALTRPISRRQSVTCQTWAAVITDAEATDEAELCGKLGPALTCPPGERLVRAENEPGRKLPWGIGWCPRPEPNCPMVAIGQ